MQINEHENNNYYNIVDKTKYIYRNEHEIFRAYWQKIRDRL